MAVRNTEDHLKKILVLSEGPIPQDKFHHFTHSFTSLTALEQYTYDNKEHASNCHLYISNRYAEEWLLKSIEQTVPFERIHIYNDSDAAFRSIKKRFESLSTVMKKKLDYRHQRDLIKDLTKAESARALSPSRPTYDTTIDNINASNEERLNAKVSNTPNRLSSVSKGFASMSQHGFLVKIIEQFDRRFICESCQLIFREPYQLACSHRHCKPCINIEKYCATCSEVIAHDKAWLDRGFQNEMQNSSIICSDCEWIGPLKFYQEHIEQNHHPFIICPICNEQVDENGFRQHCLNGIHQRNLTAFCSVLVTKRNPTKMESDNYQRSSSSVAQQNRPLEDHSENAQVTSVDGTFTWKITDFERKRMDAVSGRQKSIYSPPFYSSPTGYKICLRLLLNGDSNGRGTHISLFLVIMRGDYDAIVHWPFEFKVTFSLLNQVSLNNNHSVSFWSDTTSTSFQRPTTNMNIPYGFSKSFPIDLLEQSQNQCVQDDTMFIKWEIDPLANKLESPSTDDVDELSNDDNRQL